MEKISIIVPVYNVEKYLKRCISSIVGQTYQNIEILLIDDGSTDQSNIICDEYAKRDSRIRVIHRENKGVAEARNVGLNLADGEYIGFIDADDYIEPDMYERLLQALLCENAEMAACGYYEEFGRRIEKRGIGEMVLVFDQVEALRDFMRRGSRLGCSNANKLIKKDILLDIRYREYVVGEDVDFMFRFLQNCRRSVCIGYLGYHYVHREHSATTSSFRRESMDIITVVDAMLVDVKKTYPDLVLEMYAYQLYWYIATLQVMYSRKGERKSHEEQEILRKTIRSGIWNYLKNPYTYYVDKILAISHILHCFSFSYYLYCISASLYHHTLKKWLNIDN